jgi:hypothetical protein
MKRQSASHEADWFPETFSEPCRVFRAVLDDPRRDEKIAMSLCLHELCPRLRGDGKSPGHTIITYGLPLFFSVEISHPSTRYLAELAGIAPPKKTRGVRYAPPCDKAIAAEMERIKGNFAPALESAAIVMRKKTPFKRP